MDSTRRQDGEVKGLQRQVERVPEPGSGTWISPTDAQPRPSSPGSARRQAVAGSARRQGSAHHQTAVREPFTRLVHFFFCGTCRRHFKGFPGLQGHHGEAESKCPPEPRADAESRAATLKINFAANHMLGANPADLHVQRQFPGGWDAVLDRILDSVPVRRTANTTMPVVTPSLPGHPELAELLQNLSRKAAGSSRQTALFEQGMHEVWKVYGNSRNVPDVVREMLKAVAAQCKLTYDLARYARAPADARERAKEIAKYAQQAENATQRKEYYRDRAASTARSLADVRRQLEDEKGLRLKAEKAETRLRREVKEVRAKLTTTITTNDELTRRLAENASQAAILPPRQPAQVATTIGEAVRGTTCTQPTEYLRQIGRGFAVVINEFNWRIKSSVRRLLAQSNRFSENLSVNSVRALLRDGLHIGNKEDEIMKGLHTGGSEPLDVAACRVQHGLPAEIVLYINPTKLSDTAASQIRETFKDLPSYVTAAVDGELEGPRYTGHHFVGLLGNARLVANNVPSWREADDVFCDWTRAVFTDIKGTGTNSARPRWGYRLVGDLLPCPEPILMTAFSAEWKPPTTVSGSVASSFDFGEAIGHVANVFASMPSLHQGVTAPRHPLLTGTFKAACDAEYHLRVVQANSKAYVDQKTPWDTFHASLSTKASGMHRRRSAVHNVDEQGEGPAMTRYVQTTYALPAYIPATEMRSAYFSYADLELQPSRVKARGYGVIVARSLPELLFIPHLGPPKYPDSDDTYTFEFPDEFKIGCIDGNPGNINAASPLAALHGLSISMMMNEPSTGERVNAIFHDGGVLTIRGIDKGEELLVWYGERYKTRSYELGDVDIMGWDKPLGLAKTPTLKACVLHYYTAVVNPICHDNVAIDDLQFAHWQRPIPTKTRKRKKPGK